MKVRFTYSKLNEINKLTDIYSEYQRFLEQKFPIYLPKSYDKIYCNTKGNKKLFAQSLSKEISRVYKKEDYTSKQEMVKVGWLKVEKKFFEYLLNLNLKVQNKYICQISLYGPQGQYRYPNTINLRVAKRQDFSQANMTIAHEILHLAVYNKAKQMKLGYQQIEGVVDLFFKETKIKNIFPNYKLQDSVTHSKVLLKRIL